MIKFKESTHSLKEDLANLLQSKEDVLLGLLGTAGAQNLATSLLKKDSLQGIYEKLPDSIKNKIHKDQNLNSFEKLQETEIVRKELGVQIRPSLNSLEALNNYYRETNPLGKNKTLDSL
jgi:hypothetical protein